LEAATTLFCFGKRSLQFSYMETPCIFKWDWDNVDKGPYNLVWPKYPCPLVLTFLDTYMVSSCDQCPFTPSMHPMNFQFIISMLLHIHEHSPTIIISNVDVGSQIKDDHDLKIDVYFESIHRCLSSSVILFVIHVFW
jgi:hypothetical protein